MHKCSRLAREKMIIRLRPYIFHDGQCKLFAVGRKSNFSKESDSSRSADRLSPSTVTAANDDPPEISCFLNIFMIFRENHTSLQHTTERRPANRQQRFKIASLGDEVTRRRNAFAEMAAFEFIQSAGSVVDSKPQ